MRCKSDPSDLTDAQWNRLKPLLPPAKPGGRSRSVDLRQVLNGIFSMVRGGYAWKMMPHDLPRWSTCYNSFRQWRNDRPWRRISDTLRNQVRRKAMRKTSPGEEIGGWILEIVPRPEKPKDKPFNVMKRRGIVERTFGWLGRNRRLRNDYER